MIDAHVHIWDLSRGETLIALKQFPQLTGKAFLPVDMNAMLDDTGAASAVLVHGPATRAHTEFCLSLAKSQERILSVIGWVDARGEDPLAELDAHSQDSDFRGIRLTPMLDSHPEAYLRSAAIDALLRRCAEQGLVVEVLAPVPLLGAVRDLCRAHPDCTVVVAHFGWPDIDADDNVFWRSAMNGIAECENACVKISGLPMAGGNGNERWRMLRFLDPLLQFFSPGRLLYASNWPVMTAVTTPVTWRDDLLIMLEKISESERQSILHDNTARLYTSVNQP